MTRKVIPLAMILLMFLNHCISPKELTVKPRILISSDIGGTDPDDFQSMIHLLMYADLFQIEGLVSSPYGNGTTSDFLRMIDLYEEDFNELNTHAEGFPTAHSLRGLCKQGAISEAPFKGFSMATEGSNWLIECAKNRDVEPLWILVWGGLEDLAQALHDAPEIKENIRVYWIGGPNKKWSVNAYTYIAANHPDLWIIEANATYRGWFMDADSPNDLKGDLYYENFIQERGAIGRDFKNHYHGELKMGDTPSLAYVMNGNPDDPMSDSWGGSFTPISRSSRHVFSRNTTLGDTVATYGVIEWRFTGPELVIPDDSACFTMEINGQIWPGHYLGNGVYGIRYASKKPETSRYTTQSDIEDLNGQTGQFVSITPWPGKPSPDDFLLADHWFSDRPDPELFIGVQQGAKTISRYREEFLMDWAKRWKWLH